jgi:hypothetical protein
MVRHSVAERTFAAMLRRGSIAFKIFGLSLLLLAFMVILSIVNTSLVRTIEGQLRELRSIGQPLSHTLADLDMCGARRRIAFERLARSYGSSDPHPVQEALLNHARFDGLADTLTDRPRAFSWDPMRWRK